jgi:hypothetical protein
MSGLKYGVDFTIEPLKKRGQGHRKATFKPPSAKVSTMQSLTKSPTKEYKNCLEIRNYWAQRKREQRSKKNTADQ